MTRTVTIFGIILVQVLLGCEVSSASHECGAGTSARIPYKWCIDRPSSGTQSSALMYYLHGSGGSEESWFASPENQAIRKEWKASAVAEPTIISISFGEQWLLTDLPRDGGKSLYEIVTKEVMPKLESKAFLSGKPSARFLMGESMGGFNAAQLLRDQKRFQKIALLCPGIMTVGPYSTDSEINAYIERHRPYINSDLVLGLVEWGKAEFKSDADWKRHSAIDLADSVSSDSPQLYVSCGSEDDYGFFEGSMKFVEKARKNGARVDWAPLSGGHCAVDPASVARYLRVDH